MDIPQSTIEAIKARIINGETAEEIAKAELPSYDAQGACEAIWDIQEELEAESSGPEEALFAVGDVVYHRASGRKAVITRVCSACTNPAHLTGFHCLGRSDCNHVEVHAYDISLDFDETIECVDGLLLSADTPTGKQL